MADVIVVVVDGRVGGAMVVEIGWLWAWCVVEWWGCRNRQYPLQMMFVLVEVVVGGNLVMVVVVEVVLGDLAVVEVVVGVVVVLMVVVVVVVAVVVGYKGTTV